MNINDVKIIPTRKPPLPAPRTIPYFMLLSIQNIAKIRNSTIISEGFPKTYLCQI